MAAAMARPDLIEMTHEWNRLGRLICKRCGLVLPPLSCDSDDSSKSDQLARFGLRTDGDTILEP